MRRAWACVKVHHAYTYATVLRRRDFGADEVFLTNNVGELMSTFPNERTTFNDGPKQTFHMAVRVAL